MTDDGSSSNDNDEIIDIGNDESGIADGNRNDSSDKGTSERACIHKDKESE